jgi:hypothetical protein
MSLGALAGRARARLSQVIFRRLRLRGRGVAAYFTGLDKVYVASADQFAGLAAIAEAT